MGRGLFCKVFGLGVILVGDYRSWRVFGRGYFPRGLMSGGDWPGVIGWGVNTLESCQSVGSDVYSHFRHSISIKTNLHRRG